MNKVGVDAMADGRQQQVEGRLLGGAKGAKCGRERSKRGQKENGWESDLMTADGRLVAWAVKLRLIFCSATSRRLRVGIFRIFRGQIGGG